MVLGSECSADAEQKATAEKLYFIGPGFISLVSNARFVGQVDHIGIEGEVLHNLVANRKIDALGCVPENILRGVRSEEHTSELQSLMRITYAVFCLKKNKKQ